MELSYLPKDWREGKQPNLLLSVSTDASEAWHQSTYGRVYPDNLPGMVACLGDPGPPSDNLVASRRDEMSKLMMDRLLTGNFQFFEGLAHLLRQHATLSEKKETTENTARYFAFWAVMTYEGAFDYTPTKRQVKGTIELMMAQQRLRDEREIAESGHFAPSLKELEDEANVTPEINWDRVWKSAHLEDLPSDKGRVKKG